MERVKCTAKGIYVTEQPQITLPKDRAEFTDVPGRLPQSGRSGSPADCLSLTTTEDDDVYDDMTLAAECVVSDPTQIPTIAAWLKGAGTVTFANRQGGYYYARIVNQIPFDIFLRGCLHRSFSVNFWCKPFCYYTPGTDISITEQ